MTSPLTHVNRGLLRLRSSMTPGQRQTAALAFVLAAGVLVAGSPLRVVDTAIGPPAEGPAAAAPPAAAAVASTGAPTGTSAPDQAVATAPFPPPVAATLTVAAGPVGAETPTAANTAPATWPGLRVVALVRAGDSTVPGRDDATIAGAFLRHAGVAATVVDEAGDGARLCSTVESAGTVVIASVGVDPALRGCLIAAGETLVDYDQIGDQPPSAQLAGQVVSTGRGIGPSLVDAGRWGIRAGAIGRRVGVVSVTSAQAAVAAVLPQLHAAGVNVVRTAFLSDTTPPDVVAIRAAVLDFAHAGVATVMFSAPVAVQDQWVAEAAVVSPGARYLVADGFDAVTDESYPPVFDGAIAYTTVRGPWAARVAGTTPTQAACQSAWEAAAHTSTMLPGTETTEVYAWCEEAGMVASALRTTGQLGPFSSDLRAARVASPLTSDLAPLGGAGFGPAEDAVVVWSSSCTCWTQRTGFAPRPDP